MLVKRNTVSAALLGSSASTKNVMSVLINYLAFVRRHGVKCTAEEMAYRLINRWHDWRLGIRTIGRIQLSDIGINHQDSRDSMPIGYHAFLSILKRVPVDTTRTTFVDFGVGKGRAVCAAATFAFKRIIGVELSDVLVELARTNLNGMKQRKTKDVDIRQGDATQFEIPHDANLIYFFNPFAGETLSTVVANLRRSYQTSPRKIYIVYFNDDHFAKIVAGDTWLKKIYETGFYPGISCGVYET